MPEPINARKKLTFLDHDDHGPALRGFTFDEAVIVTSLIESLVQRNTAQPKSFTVSEALHLTSAMTATLMGSDPLRYLRPMVEFLQRLVSSGLLVETTQNGKIGGDRAEDRRFASTAKRALDEWGRPLAALALGLPLVAHQYADVAVRVHVDDSDEADIASGVVIGRNWVLTNEHVVRAAPNVCVSWGTSARVRAHKIIPSGNGLDLAVLSVPGLQPLPYTWLRPPETAEPILVLAYPSIPGVASRPLLSFNGWVASAEPVVTIFGEQQIIVTAVMNPGASGGPIFGADGCMVGLVVQTLEGQHVVEHGANRILQSTFHAALPADVIMREVRGLHPELALFNEWG